MYDSVRDSVRIRTKRSSKKAKLPRFGRLQNWHPIGKFENAMKNRLSHKDLILLIGIVVAIIVAFTTLVYSDDQKEANKEIVPVPVKTSLVSKPAELVKKIIRKVSL